MKKLLVLPLLGLLAACQTGTYELETPTDDITAEVWIGQGTMSDFIRIDNDLKEVHIEVNKKPGKKYGRDNSGKSGFVVKDLDGTVIVSFVCTREKQDRYDEERTNCVRWEVDYSSYDKVPVGTEYRKSQ